MRAAQLLVGDLALAGIGYVPQGREIFPQLTVLENLKIGLMANPRRPRTVPNKWPACGFSCR